jgi:hypothetical protein
MIGAAGSPRWCGGGACLPAVIGPIRRMGRMRVGIGPIRRICRIGRMIRPIGLMHTIRLIRQICPTQMIRPIGPIRPIGLMHTIRLIRQICLTLIIRLIGQIRLIGPMHMIHPLGSQSYRSSFHIGLVLCTHVRLYDITIFPQARLGRLLETPIVNRNILILL